MSLIDLLGKESWTRTEGTRDDELYPLLNRIHEQQASLVNEYVEDGLLLDIGSGRNPLPAVEDAFGHVCLDPDQRLIEESNRKQDTNEYIVGIGNELPFQSESISCVFLRNVVHHLDEDEQVRLFDEIHRVLTTDGSIIVFEGNENSSYRSLALGVGELIGYTEQSPHTDQHGFVDRDRLVALCEGSEFEMEEIGTTGSLLEPLAYLYPSHLFLDELIQLRRYLPTPWWQYLIAKKQ